MRKRARAALTLASVLAVSSGVVATSMGAVTGTVSYDQAFSTPGESSVSVPPGVRAIDVVAVGGNGGSISNVQGVTANGGRGAQVTGRISVTPGSTIWVEVGGNGTGNTFSAGQGGFNGGGDARVGPTTPSWYNPAAGGGGASDVRTAPRSAGLSPDPRLIIAAGGGGAGKPLNGSSSAARGHGGAGFAGSGAAGASGTTPSGGGGGGAGASSSSGGAGGTSGPSGGTSGTSGSLGQGGHGGYSPYNSPSGGGGGGGGGRYGGGGGRSGGSSDFGSGGGGGGGSSLFPAGGTIVVAPAGSQPRVRLSYTIPNTGIATGPGAVTNDTTPDFSFEASETGSTFECRIDSDDNAAFEPCGESFTAPEQAEGTHTLEVRAVNAMRNFDPTPASSTFTVDTTAPVTTISGPATTTDTTPTFTYEAESGSTFRCAFDAAPLAPCAASGVTAPPLTVGAHELAVEATDAAGNVEVTPASKAFTVEAPPGPDTAPSDTAPPELSLAAKRKQRLGKPVKVKVACDEACTIVAEGKVKPKGKPPLPKAAQLKRKQVKLDAGERKTLKLKLSKKTARQLKRGAERAVAKVNVNATDASGNVANAKRKVKLR